MIYKVSTTGTVSDVVLDDLGARTLTHPTVELDLGLEYTDDELLDSDDLADAIVNGELTLVEKSGGTVTEEELQTAVSGTISYVDYELYTLSGTLSAEVEEKTSLATVQLDDANTFAVQTTWSDYTFDTTSYENEPDVLEHDPSNPGRILIKADGTYSLSYGTVVEAQTTFTFTYGRLYKNGIEEISASDSQIRTYQTERHELTGSITVDLDADDYVNLQVSRSADGDVNIMHARFNAIKLDGVKGSKGDVGPSGEDGEDGVLTVSGTADYFNGYDAAGVTQLGTSYTDIPLTEGYTTPAFSHSGAEITINADNTYLIIGRFTVAQPSTAIRSEAQMRLVADTGSGYVEIPGTVGVCYSRNTTQGKSTASAQVVLDLNAGDKIKLQAQENSGGTLFGAQNGSGLTLFTTAGQSGPQGIQGLPGEDGVDGTDGADGQDGVDAGGTLAVVQARATSAITLSNTFTNISFNATDVENDTDLLEHNDTNTDRIEIYDEGAFLISYDFGIDAPASADQVTYAEAQLTISGTDVIDGSEANTTSFNESSLDGNPLFYNHLSNSCLVLLSSGDYITLQMRYVEDAADTMPNGTIKVVKLVGARGVDGVDGDAGPTGAGSSVLVRDQNNSYLSNTPNDNLRFSGGGMSVAAEGDSTARIHVDGTIQLQDDGSDIESAPFNPANFKKINFTGNGIEAALTSTELATVTVTRSVFGDEYQTDSDETETNTNSVTPVAKVTFNTSSLPAGDYRIGWYYEWRRTTTSNDYMANIVVDSTTTIMEHRQESQDVNTWNNVGGHYRISLTSGTHTIVFSHYGDSTGSTSYTRRARLEIWRVS